MFDNLRRAAVAAATLFAVVCATLLSLSGSAQAHEAVTWPEQGGIARFSVTEEEGTWWFLDGHIICGELTNSLNSERQKEGGTLGVTTDECFAWMDDCMVQHGVHAWLFIWADNRHVCTPPS